MAKKIFFTLCAVFSCLLQAELPYLEKNLIYVTPAAAAKADADFFEQASGRLANFIGLCDAGSYDEGYQQWYLLCSRFCMFKRQLDQTLQKSALPEVKAKAGALRSTLDGRLQTLLSQNSPFKERWVKNGLAADALTPQQRFVTESILKEMPERTESVKEGIKKLAAAPKQNFTVIEGSAKAAPSKALTVLTANILCFPGILTYYYGGLAPWKDRIEKLCSIFIKSGAEIICLQEIWDPEAFSVLIKQLQKNYSWFVYDAGSQFGTLDPEKIGFNSGLLIASKIPLSNVTFDPFPDPYQGPHKRVNRGLLRASAEAGGTTVCFGTTHLQYNSGPDTSRIRKAQLRQSYDLLEELRKVQRGWSFLAGDINIDAFSKEFVSSGLKELFHIPYLKGQDKISSANATATNYFHDLVYAAPMARRAIVPSYELIDYCISPNSRPMPSTTKKLTLFSVEEPSKALSDHHGLLTTWDLSDLSSSASAAAK